MPRTPRRVVCGRGLVGATLVFRNELSSVLLPTLGLPTIATKPERVAGVVEAGDEVSELQYQRIRQASTFATEVARDAVEFAYGWSGSKGLRGPNALARCVRDMHAATQHVYVDSTTLVNAAPTVFASYAAN